MASDEVHGLDAAARGRVDAAIAAAEARTSAEIVVGLVARSGAHRHVPYVAGLIGAVVAVLLFAAAFWLRNRIWPTVGFDLFLGVAVVGFLLGALAARNGATARALAGDDALLEACERRAAELFAAHGVARTAARNGVLLFVSLFEHKVLVWGDDAVSAALTPDDYRGVAEIAIGNLRAGRVEEALIDATQALGLLLEKPFPRAANDVNELPDRLYTA
ncbi:MAG TPA: TPM domain-containing protein [Planctomycetota bacterium]|nr:TPM domain-containing protein [Planctomycetota bacterium]